MGKLDVRAKEWDNVRALTFEVRMETSGQIPGIPEADGELIPESSVRTESRFAIAFAEYAKEKDPKKEKEKLYDLARAYYLWVPLESVILDMGRKGGYPSASAGPFRFTEKRIDRVVRTDHKRPLDEESLALEAI
jgi:hypothetical protein